MLPAAITAFQRAISSSTNFENCAPSLATTSKPTASYFDLASGEVAAAANSASSRFLTGAGKPFGAAAPCQD